MPYQRYKNNNLLNKKELLELDNELKITNNNLNII